MRDDIDQSQGTAQQIIRQDKEGEHLRFQAQDAASKMGLLTEEVNFTNTLISVYERVGRLRHKLDSIQAALQRQQLHGAIGELVEAENEFEGVQASPSTRVFMVLHARLASLHEDARARLLDHWSTMVYVGSTPPTIRIKHQSQGG